MSCKNTSWGLAYKVSLGTTGTIKPFRAVKTRPFKLSTIVSNCKRKPRYPISEFELTSIRPFPN